MWSWIAALLAGVLSALLAQRLWFPLFWRDALFLTRVLRYGARLELYKRTSRVVTVVDRFVQQAQRIPDKPFLIHEGVTYTYGELEERSNRVARVFEDALKEGDTVALLMNNEPDFLSVWFGLSKLGCAVAFLNTNTRSRSLLHCFRCCGAELLVLGAGNTDTPPVTGVRAPDSFWKPPLALVTVV